MTKKEFTFASTVPMQDACYDVWADKHALSNNDGVRIDKTIEDSRIRIANALAAPEKASVRKDWANKYLWALQNGAIPAGRIYSNAGAGEHKRAVSLINCVVSGRIDDSIESIMRRQYEAALTLKAGCGIGYEFSTLRPNGYPVHGAGAATSGPLGFMGGFDKYCETIESAGGRRGAQMGTFSVEHPDVEDFIKAKGENGKLRKFNLSVLVTDEFISAVKNDADWEYKWLGKPTGKIVRARDLWDLIMRATYEYSEPGFLLIDRINEMNNLWFCESIRATNPCITGDTKVAVVNRGAVTIKQLALEGKDVPVYSQNLKTGELEIRMGRNPRKTGSKHTVYRVTLDDGSSFKANAVHKMITRDGEYIQVKDMKIGTSLLPFKMKENSKEEICVRSTGDFRKEHHVLAEFVTDEYLSFGRSAYDLCVHHKDGNHLNNDPSNIEVLTNSEHSCQHITERNPMQVWWPNATPKQKRCYRKAMSIAQSGVNNGMYGKCHSRKTLEKIGRKTAERMASPEFKAKFGKAVRNGMKTAKAREGIAKSIRVRAAKCGSAAIALGFTLTRSTWNSHADEIREMCGSFVKLSTIEKYFESWRSFQHEARRYNHKVVSIEECGIEDVYNITVDTNHNYFIVTNEYEKNGKMRWSGVLSKNCGEQPLPPFGACLLGSVSLVYFVEDPFTDKARFNFQKFEKVVRIFNRMLDNVVEINGLPLKEQQKELKSKRRHGLGFMGLGSMLAMMGIRYGSKEAQEFAGNITYHMALWSYSEGANLAKEKGTAPILATKENLEKFLKSKYLAQFNETSEGREVLNDIKKYGCRYTHAISIAPTGTIAFGIGNNQSSGIEPSYKHSQLRNKVSNTSSTKEQVTVESFELLALRVHEANQGRELGDEYLTRPGFQTADMISPKEHILMQSAVQKWTDSSISKTINVPADTPFEEFKDIYMFAIEHGLKGCTTYRPNPSKIGVVITTQEEQSSKAYEFTLKSGRKVALNGSEKVMYKGKERVVALLGEAIREGTFSK
jgi:ribonucleoside-diphosphate reductase alpha chain